MDDKEVVNDLIRRLADIFETSEEIKGLAQEAGLNTTHISFGGSAFVLWRRVVKRAINEGKLYELIAATSRNLGGEHPALRIIKERLLLVTVGTTAPDFSTSLEERDPLKASAEMAGGVQYVGLPITPDTQVSVPSERSARLLEETIVAPTPAASENLPKQPQNTIISFRSFLEKFPRNFGITSIILVILVTAILTSINLTLLRTPWPTEMLTTIPLIIITFTLASTLIILILLVIASYRWRLFNRRWSIINSLFLLAFLLVNIALPSFFLYNVQYAVSSASDPSAQASLWIMVLTIINIFISALILLIVVFLGFAKLVELSRSQRFLLLADRLRWLRRPWARGGSILLPVVLAAGLIFSTFALNTMQAVANNIEYVPRIGLCDGRCFADVDRLDGLLKMKAADELNQQHRKAACAYLNWATQEDTTDGEAKISYEDQCGSDINGAPLHCPCITYVAAIALAKGIHTALPAENAVDTAYTDSAIYNNGVNRSILQGVYLQQKAWNAAHKNGPAMYIFVANVGDVSDQQASQWQQQVAGQIVALQQTESEYRINGVVGLPEGTDTLMGLLNQDAIPMISIASRSDEDFSSQNYLSDQNYLLQIAPTVQQEMSAAAYFLTKDIVKKKFFSIVVCYYAFNGQYQKMALTFNNDVSNVGVKQSYDDLPQHTTADVVHQATYVAKLYDAILFAGPINDLITFVKTLRQTDKVTPVLASNTAYQLAYSYLPPTIKSSLLNLYFTAFAYHEKDLPMSKDFGDTYDPKSIHSGNIYTYQLPTSDAILAYDAMGVFAYIIEHYKVQLLPNWQDQKAFLSSKPLTLVSGSTRFATNGNTPLVKTVLLLQIGSGGYADRDSVS